MSGFVSFDLFRFVKLSPSGIQRKLALGLPGPSAQWLMAPANRPQQTAEQEWYTRSAVLILILFGGNEPEIVFIRRASYNGVHRTHYYGACQSTRSTCVISRSTT